MTRREDFRLVTGDGRYSADEIAGMYASVTLDGLRKD